MRKILMIAHEYFPRQGTTRALKFSKYLPKFGWQPFVITTRDLGEVAKDKATPPDTSVYYISPFNSLGFIRSIGWMISVILEAKMVDRRVGINVIYATHPPPKSLFAGVLVKKIIRKPLVADYRDAWTLNPYLVECTGVRRTLRHKINQFLESFVLRNANHVVAATKGIMVDYKRCYPYLKDKFSLIHNGFDTEDLPKGESDPFEKFTILYTGTFYGLRTPELLFEALASITNSGLIPRDEMQVMLIGKRSGLVRKVITKYKLEDIVTDSDPVPHSEALELMSRSHLLLLIEPADAMTTKLYEYLASWKPILALVPKEGEAEGLIKWYSDISYIITSQDANEVAQAIISCYMRWKTGARDADGGERFREFISQYNREALTEKLVTLLNGVVER